MQFRPILSANVVVPLLAVVALCVFAAHVTWQLILLSQPEALPVAQSRPPAADQVRFTGLQLFVPVAAVKKTTEQLKETNLPLKINGLLLSYRASKNQVILSIDGQQKVVMAGERLPYGGTVLVSEIYDDRIILLNNGRSEYLMLETLPGQVALRQPLEPAVTELVLANTPLAEQLPQLRQQLVDDPLTLSRFLRFTPWQQGDDMQGFRLAPGRDKALYETLRLQPDDVLLSLNGLPVANPARLASLPQLLQQSSQLKLGMLRDGQPLTYILYL